MAGAEKQQTRRSGHEVRMERRKEEREEAEGERIEEGTETRPQRAILRG